MQSKLLFAISLCSSATSYSRRLNAALRSIVAFALVIDVAQFSFRVEGAELRLCRYIAKQPCVHAEDRIDDRLKIIAARDACPVVDVRLVGRRFFRSAVRFGFGKGLGEMCLSNRALLRGFCKAFDPIRRDAYFAGRTKAA